MSRVRLRRLLEERARAEAALARAVARKEDPWRVAELRLRAAELAERALDAEFAPDPELGAGVLR